MRVNTADMVKHLLYFRPTKSVQLKVYYHNPANDIKSCLNSLHLHKCAVMHRFLGANQLIATVRIRKICFATPVV